MFNSNSKPTKKCEIVMELGASGETKLTATKAANSIVSQEEAVRFINEARVWLEQLVVSWESCYQKSKEEG